MKNAEAMASLDQDVQHLAATFLFKCSELGIVLGIHEGYRSFARQKELWLIGRDPTTGEIVHPDQIVTRCVPGHSWHNWRRAFDCHIDTFPGDTTPQNVWDGPWGQIGDIAQGLGLTWGGRFLHPDSPHMEYPAGRTIAAMMAAHPEGLG
jgi:hypothetical protein